MSLKIYNKGLPTLCSSCRNGTVIVSTSGAGLVYCNRMSKQIKQSVEQCSDFSRRELVDRWDMEKIAWIVKTDSSGLKVGFVAPGSEEHRKMTRDD